MAAWKSRATGEILVPVWLAEDDAEDDDGMPSAGPSRPADRYKPCSLKLTAGEARREELARVGRRAAGPESRLTN